MKQTAAVGEEPRLFQTMQPVPPPGWKNIMEEDKTVEKVAPRQRLADIAGRFDGSAECRPAGVDRGFGLLKCTAARYPPGAPRGGGGSLRIA